MIEKSKKDSPKWDSNTRPAAYEADALPTELLRHLSGFSTYGISLSRVRKQEGYHTFGG